MQQMRSIIKKNSFQNIIINSKERIHIKLRTQKTVFWHQPANAKSIKTSYCKQLNLARGFLQIAYTNAMHIRKHTFQNDKFFKMLQK